jgi:hypothetical protein
LYGITHSQKRGKTKVLQKKEVALLKYMKKLQLINHLIMLTQLQLKVAKDNPTKVDTFQEWHT